MKITNKLNLPQALVNAVERNLRDVIDGTYSATEILKSTREIILTRQHWDDIEQDVSDLIWQIFGTAVHKLASDNDDTGNAEIRLYSDVDDTTLSGQYDLYDADTFTLIDYKTASVWKVIYGDFDDWRRQGLIYAWLNARNGQHVERVRFHAFLKDWSSADAKYKADYPQLAVYTYEFTVGALDIVEIDEYIRNKINAITAVYDELPLCTEKERWNTGTKYAAMKNGRKTAVRVADNRDDVVGLGDYIEERPGVDKKCDNYCLAAPYCTQYKGGLK
jgi:hypothetical protein